LERGQKSDKAKVGHPKVVMGIVIDSSVLIAWERKHLDLETQLAEHVEEEFAISAMTASELLHGVHRATTPAQRSQREAFVEGLLLRIPVFSFGLVTARAHARLSAELAAKKIPVGPHDLIIAATAMANGYSVAAHDKRSFPKIPGLNFLRW
jgi:tRNA(fMet)-specific endonuclease VapC